MITNVLPPFFMVHSVYMMPKCRMRSSETWSHWRLYCDRSWHAVVNDWLQHHQTEHNSGGCCLLMKLLHLTGTLGQRRPPPRRFLSRSGWTPDDLWSLLGTSLSNNISLVKFSWRFHQLLLQWCEPNCEKCPIFCEVIFYPVTCHMYLCTMARYKCIDWLIDWCVWDEKQTTK